jgi:RNA polymerase sigma-70 factor (ECF subfamily)
MTGIESFGIGEVAVNDATLVAMARENNKEAFGELVRRHHSACLRLATFQLRDRGEAEEEVQNAFKKAYEHLDQFKGTAEFSSWLLRIVTNNCMMRLRLRSRARMLHLDGDYGQDREGSIEVPSTAPDPESELIQRQMAQVLQREMRRIPRMFQRVVLLRDMRELSMTDVARSLGISVPAAKSRLFRARAELRRRVLDCSGSRRHYQKGMPARSTRCPVQQA